MSSHLSWLWLAPLQTFINWNRTTALYVPSSYLYQCQLSVISPAPSSVDDFTVTSYHVDNRNLITLNMRWSPPTEPNGALGAYNVCVGGEALDFQEEVQPHSRHICGILDVSERKMTYFYVQSLHQYNYGRSTVAPK